MGQWRSTMALRLAAESVYDDLTAGRIDCDTAAKRGAQIRTAVKLVGQELDALKASGQKLKAGQAIPNLIMQYEKKE